MLLNSFFCYPFGRLRCHQHLIQTHFVNNTIRVNFSDRNITLVYSVLLLGNKYIIYNISFVEATNYLKLLHIDCSLFGIAGFLFLHLCNFSSPCKKLCEFWLETQNHNSLNTHSSHSILQYNKKSKHYFKYIQAIKWNSTSFVLCS